MGDTTPQALRMFRPAPNILAFYVGRPEAPYPAQNWQQMGIALGTCSYAIVSGGEALVYDTHISPAIGHSIRKAVEAEGAQRIRVVLSHHHTDHVAGTEAFRDCPILANAATANAMVRVRAELEAGDPPVTPLIMPTETFECDLDLDVGGVQVALRSFQIHSHDGLVLWLPNSKTLLAGDTLEDPVTFVCEAEELPAHLTELDRLAALPVQRILPNHGDPARIASGGYAASLIGATQSYIRWLLAYPDDPARQSRDLKTCLAGDIAAGALIYHPAYEQVHRRNIQAVMIAAQTAPEQKETSHAT